MSGRSRTLRRLERVLTMVPWLLDNPGVAVEEVCERFDVSRAELLRDLDILGYCGVPGYGGGDLVDVTVAGDIVSVRMADFFRRPLHLSVKEALTLLLAGRALAGMDALPESAPLARAVDRLERALGSAGSGAPRVAVDLTAPGAEHLEALRGAVAAQRVVRLVYRSGASGETSERAVEPWSLTAASGAWYLQGWCRAADGPRDFRLDRIRGLEVTAERCPPPSGTPDPPVYRPGADDPEVVLELDPAAWWLAEWAVVDDVEDDGPRRRVRLRVRHLDWAAHVVLGLGGAGRVLSPARLRERVAELAAAALDRYRD